MNEVCKVRTGKETEKALNVAVKRKILPSRETTALPTLLAELS